MSNSINLVEKQAEKNNKVDLAGRLKKISLVILVLLGLFSIVLFLLSYRFSIGYVRQEENKLAKKMSSLEQIGSKVFLLNSRLTDVSSLLSLRSKYNDVSDTIISVTPYNLKILKYQIDSSSVQIQANSENLADINDFLNSILSLSENKTFSSVLINNLSADATGYSLQITLN